MSNKAEKDVGAENKANFPIYKIGDDGGLWEITKTPDGGFMKVSTTFFSRSREVSTGTSLTIDPEFGLIVAD